MDRSIKCVGWVFASLGIVALFAIALLVFCAGVKFAAEYTRDFFGLRDSLGGPIAFGYIMLTLGVAIGVGLCWENQ